MAKRKVAAGGVVQTLACEAEAKKLRAYCEERFPVGEPTSETLSVTGEKYTELCQYGTRGYATPAAARIAAIEHFEQYAKGRKGVLYWRIVPEIAYSSGRRTYGYYLRLLISDRPPK